MSLLTKISYLAITDSSADRDLQKVLQQLEPQISFLEELTKMGGAMRTVMTKILTNQQAFKELCMGKYLLYYPTGRIVEFCGPASLLMCVSVMG